MQNLTADNGQEFKYGYDSVSDKYGYYVAGSGGADTFVPFSSGGLGDAENVLIMAGNLSQMIALNSEGNSYYHTGYNRSSIINALNNGECPFVSSASAVSGTTALIAITLAKSGYYSIGYENNFATGRIGYFSANETHNVSADYNAICFYGDTNPFA